MASPRQFTLLGRAAGAALLGSVGYFSFGGSDSNLNETVRCDSLLRFNTSGKSSVQDRAIECRDGTRVFPWSAPSREQHIERLKHEKFDVLVIGGGATGSGVALDAATRGLKVALVERDDFASGTSGRSTKLIHGGVRYLENAFKQLDYGQYLLVKEALEERSHMLKAAPYLARALPIMVPLEKWWQVPYYYAGCKVYDLVAGRNLVVPQSMFLSKGQALYSFPMLNPDKLKGAVVYYDGQMNDTRYSLTIALTAAQHGATLANYVNVESLTRDSKTTGVVNGAVVKDYVSGETFNVRARRVINATGPFTDAIRQMDQPDDEPSTDKESSNDESKTNKVEDLIVPAAGIHVVLPDHFSPAQMGLIVPQTKDDRVLFFLPWEGGTLCGTTDSKTPITMLPRPSREEVEFVLAESSRYLNRKVRHSDVKAAWSGIRPLAKDLRSVAAKDGTKSISREHVVEVSPHGMVTIGGGKWTTYRRMAQDALDKVLSLDSQLDSKAEVCQTRNMMLIGADRAGIVCDQSFDIITITLRESYGFDRDIAEHLTRNYGTRALSIAELIRGGYENRKPNLHPKRLVSKYPFLDAEVVFAVRQEYCMTAVDFLARRCRLAYLDHRAALEALPAVVDMMGGMLQWSKAKKKEEMQRGLEFLDTMMLADFEDEEDDDTK